MVVNTVPTVIHARVRRLDRELLREDLARAQGPVLIVVLCLLPVLLWAFARPPGERFVTLAVALRSLAIAAALAGASAFATNLILGARLKPIAALFGGLDRLYRMHRRLGKLAFLLLLGHAGLITASYAAMSTAAALQLLVPRAGSAVTYGMVALGAMAVA